MRDGNPDRTAAATLRRQALSRWNNEGGAGPRGSLESPIWSQAGERVLYPLRLQPLYEYRVWGGRRLAKVLGSPLPGDGPIGEAWVLSDREDHPSVIAEGPLKGRTLHQLLAQWPEQVLGRLAGRFHRFPLLLKFLDAREALSVQVHPSDRDSRYLPAGESGKTEAWIVLEAGPKAQIHAGLTPGTTALDLQRALANGTVVEHLHRFTPAPGDAILMAAGTIHSLSDVVVFEIQQNSDVTFRLYDWDRVDPTTRQLRALQVDEALACIDFAQGPVGPITPTLEESQDVRRERVFLCDHFGVWRIRGKSQFAVGAAGAPRVLVCLEGQGDLQHEDTDYPIGKGDVMLLPAVVGECAFHPRGSVELLELSLPDGDAEGRPSRGLR
jgi:mannose-6-phosphate isomerase